MFVTTRVTFRDAPSNPMMPCAEAGVLLVAFDRATLPWHAGQVRQSSQAQSGRAAGGRGSCSRPRLASPAGSGAAPGLGPRAQYHRARDTAVATCRTSFEKPRNAGRSVPRCRPRLPPGVASGASWSTAVALKSSSRLHSKVFGLRTESSTCHLCPVISYSRPHPVGGTGYSDREDVSAPINTFVRYP
jgi:hypothetical protein